MKTIVKNLPALVLVQNVPCQSLHVAAFVSEDVSGFEWRRDAESADAQAQEWVTDFVGTDTKVFRFPVTVSAELPNDECTDILADVYFDYCVVE